MKTRTPAIIAICCLAVVTPAFAKKKGKGNHSEPAPQSQPAAPKAPSADLAAFLGTHLDRLLSPLATGSGERREADMKTHNVPVATRAAVTNLDQQFRASASAATPADLPIFQRAVAVTTSLAQLMDERNKQSDHYVNSRTTRSLSDLAQQKTKNQRKDARHEAHETKNAFSDNIEQQWLQTAARYRQQINAQMDSLRSTEQQVKAAKLTPDTGATVAPRPQN